MNEPSADRCTPRGPGPNRSSGAAVAELAAQQEGVVTRLQALALGMTADAVDARLRSGRWRRFHPGVYATFTGRPCREATLWAAVLLCGPGAMLSHRTAAELWGLLDAPADARAGRPVHVTIPSSRRVKPWAGVIVHGSSRTASSRHPTRRPPCTRLEDTVVDLTQAAPHLDAAIGMVTDAVGRRLTTYERLLAAFDSRKKLRWRAELTETCTAAGEGNHSLLEFRFLTRVERPHGLPATTRQVKRTAGRRTVFVDARDARHRVRLELDGRRGHTGADAFRDMWRDNMAVVAGDVTLRFGWSDVSMRACDTAALLAKVYLDRGWTGTPVPCGPECTLPATLDRLRTATGS